jgi:hypothetical protein
VSTKQETGGNLNKNRELDMEILFSELGIIP